MSLQTRYRVLGEIASGGMGTVLLAVRHDDVSATPIALKTMHAHLAEDPQMTAHFLDEARITARVAHSHVVKVHDVEMLGEQLVLVMEYVDGIPLTDLLRAYRKKKARLPLPIVRRILHEALLGLDAAHETIEGLVHRDVSPHNILVGADGLTKIGDFGVAIAAGRLAHTRTDGVVKGKLQYLAPEQVQGRGVDRQSDVFAAGIVLWECLAGRRLFAGVTEAETLALVLREPIAPPSSVNPDVPLDLDETCLRALERDKERRFATARELSAAIADGPMATPADVAAVVAEHAGPELAERRALLANLPPPAPAQALSQPPGGLGAMSSPPPALPTVRTRPPGKSGLPLGALLVGSIVGGALVFLALRATSSPPRASEPPASATTTLTQAPSSSTAASAPTPIAQPAVATAVAAPSSSVEIELPSTAPSPATRVGPRRGAKKPDGGRGSGRPFMPDDL